MMRESSPKGVRVKRERQEEAARYFEFAGVMMVVIDREERVTVVNRKACEVLGCGEAEVLGANWFDRFVPERMRDDVKSVFRKYARTLVGPSSFSSSEGKQPTQKVKSP